MAVKRFKVGNSHKALQASGFKPGDEFPYVPLNGDAPAVGNTYLIMDGNGHPHVVDLHGASYRRHNDGTHIVIVGPTMMGLVPEHSLARARL